MSDKLLAAVGMCIYSTVHSFILLMEMFTIHVVLTSSQESIFSFLFYNNFNEIKIYVFKKYDKAGLYELASVDAIERFQQLIYIFNILATTNKDSQKMIVYCIYVLLSEVIADTLKHFFATRISLLDTQCYY